MAKNREVNREKGSIAIYAIATVLSFIFILGGIFFTSAVIRKNQLRTMIKIKEIYAQDIGKADEIGNKVAEEIKKNEENIKTEPVEFQYTGAIQEWTVPNNGNYKLEVWGAQGGSVGTNVGFTGAYAISYVTLTKDDVLKILVGEQGGQGAGGGGTFITLTDNTPQVIAGGGGGAGGITVAAQNSNTPGDNNYGQATQNGGSTKTGGGTSGNGGKNGETNGQGAGGGGLLTAGEDGSGAGGGKAFISGGAGGTGTGESYNGNAPGNGGFRWRSWRI